MAPNDPQFPFLPTPAVTVRLGESEVIASGTAVIKPGVPFQIQVANLVYLVRFDTRSPTDQVGVEYVDQHDVGYTIALKNFDNPLGTSLNPIQVGTVAEKKVFLSLYVSAPAGAGGVHVLAYTVYWGGDHG